MKAVFHCVSIFVVCGIGEIKLELRVYIAKLSQFTVL